MNSLPREILANLLFYWLDGLSSNLWNNIIIIVSILGGIILLRSEVAKRLIENLGGLASARKEVVTEKDAEIAKLKLELRTTTQELRQAREFGDEDRVIIRKLRSRCTRYVIEINQHRLAKNISPILAGTEDEEH